MAALRPEGLRKASEVEIGFPYRDQRVSYILVVDGVVTNPRYAADKRAAAKALVAGEGQVFAVWPGQYRSDLFVIDDVAAFAAVYG